ncbi:MAG: YicC/YloC family endoribonuclease, partial [Pseudomonadota bacterium]
MQSMTGFGAAEGGDGRASWRWDLRSVNGKGLDVRLRTPSGWEKAEAEWRALVGARFARGSITLSLSVQEGGEKAALSLNGSALQAAVAAAAEAEAALAAAGLQSAGVRVDGLLALRGVLSTDGPESAPLAETATAEVTATLAAALDALATARDAEGARLAATLTALLDEIERLTE